MSHCPAVAGRSTRTAKFALEDYRLRLPLGWDEPRCNFLTQLNLNLKLLPGPELRVKVSGGGVGLPSRDLSLAAAAGFVPSHNGSSGQRDDRNTDAACVSLTLLASGWWAHCQAPGRPGLRVKPAWPARPGAVSESDIHRDGRRAECSPSRGKLRVENQVTVSPARTQGPIPLRRSRILDSFDGVQFRDWRGRSGSESLASAGSQHRAS